MATAAGSSSSAAAGAEFLRALRTELDLYIVQILQELEQLEEKRATLNALVEESRYNLGTNAVSPLQCGSSVTPLFRACTSEPESGQPQVTPTEPEAPKDSPPQEAHGVIEREEALLPPVPHEQPQQEDSPVLPQQPTALHRANSSAGSPELVCSLGAPQSAAGPENLPESSADGSGDC
ncbi:coiled-coil domain-containing protein 115-like [Sarcophilus harrisii]|uniref:coiled-coil domain-containing protein 115-like n=1 Tax=Sarcophilus harrisii TaxID=9305 RepID=UPI001301FF58|nr:coiled-coil domain-containing protein 115-like [Sarcophilus harrisii]